MRQMLSEQKNSSGPVMMGFKYKGEWMSGGSGYILNKEAVRRFVAAILDDEQNGAIRNKTMCHEGHQGSAEDYFVGKPISIHTYTLMCHEMNKYIRKEYSFILKIL